MRHRSCFRGAAAALFALAATQLSATSFLVPSDRELVNRADAVVIATTQGSYAMAKGGGIQTHYELIIERVLKGSLQAGETLSLTEGGGVFGNHAVKVYGTPEYAPGERALIFLQQRADKSWRTWGMILGRFNFVRDDAGQELLLRGASGEEVFGWDYEWKRHQEKPRAADGFLKFIDATVCGLEDPGDYVVEAEVRRPRIEPSSHGFSALDYQGLFNFGPPIGTVGTRWSTMLAGGFVTFRTLGNQSGGLDSLGGVDRAMNAWNNEPNSMIGFVRGGANGTPYNVVSGGGDSINSIEFNATNSDLSAPQQIGVAAVRVSTPITNGHADTFEADVAIRAGVPFTQTLLDEVLTHEIGHTLNFRHSNDRPPNSSIAVMHFVSTSLYGANLQAWDRDAASHVYPGSAPAAPIVNSFTASPTTIVATGSSTLSWTTTNATSVTINNGAGSFGANGSTNVSPATTTTYTLTATGPGGTATATATVTVTSPGSLRGDANGDSAVTSGDVFYLINNLFAGGPAPVGNGDANSDGGVTSGDVFFLINHLFAGGPAPQAAMSPVQPLGRRSLFGSISVGSHHGVAGSKVVIPVRVEANGNAPDALAFKVVYSPASAVKRSTIRRAGITAPRSPLFEAAPSTDDSASYVAAFSPGTLSGDQPGGEVVAEIEIELRAGTRAETEIRLTIEPETAALGDLSGNSTATVASGSLRLIGGTVTVLPRSRPLTAPDTRRHAHERRQ